MVDNSSLSNLPFSLGVCLDVMRKSYEEVSVQVRDVECYIIGIDGFQVVVPRGTEFSGFFSESGYRDVINDLRFIPRYSARLGGWSHAGFLKSAKCLVDKGLEQSLDPKMPIVFLGHSYGGAVTQNAAFLLKSMGYYVHSIVTFGSPRTFTKGTMKKLRKMNIPCWNFSNPGDPIPDLPFRWWNFRHINEVYTSRERKGYSISKNHMLPRYAEWVVSYE